MSKRTFAGAATRLIALGVDATVITIVITLMDRVGETFLGFVSVDAQRCQHARGLLALQAYACQAFAYVGPTALLSLPPLYQLLFWTVVGQTPGMMLCGIKVQGADHRPPSLIAASVRMVGHWVSMLTLGAGFAVMLWDRERRTWGDRLAGTVVVYTSPTVLRYIRNTTHLGLLVVIATALGSASCATVPKQTPLMRKLDVRPTTHELRARVNDLALVYAITMQQSADQIRATHADPLVRQAALRWKIDSVGMGSTVFFRSDPLAALLDGWLLTVQMRQFFEGQQGKARFGDAYLIAARGCRTVEAQFVLAMREMGKSSRIRATQDYIERWATRYPIHDLKLTRQSLAPFLASYAGDKSVGLMEAAGSVPETLGDISQQMHYQMWFLPKQASMEAELLVEGTAQRPEVVQALQTMRAFGELAHELNAALKSAKSALEDQKASIFEVLGAERKAVLGNIDAQRVATMRLLQDERAVVLEALREERQAFTRELDRISAKTVDRGLQRSFALIDHVFVRVVQLVLGLVAVLLLALLLWKVRAGRRQL